MTAVAVAGVTSRPVLTWRRTLASEWGKAWTLRSTRWAVAATVAINALMCLLTSLDSAIGAEGYGNSLAYMAGGYLLFAQLPLLVLGVLAGAGEFSTGSATSTFAAVPRRLPVLLAQAVTVAGIAAATAIATLVTSSLILLAGPFGGDLHLSLADGQSVRILVGGAAALVLLAVLALGAGALLRRPLVGIVVMLALALSDLALMSMDTLAQLLPGHALMALTASEDFLEVVADMGTTVVGPWASLAVLGAWVLVTLGLAGLRLHRTDV